MAFSKARHAGLDGVLRPGAFDRPFVFNAVGGRRILRKWEVAFRAACLTGRPYTPFDLERSRAQRRGVFDLAAVNTERYDAFFSLDLRIDRTFSIRDQDVVVYGGVQNVTGRENVSSVNWNRVTNRPNELLGLSQVVLAGLEWNF